MWGMRLRSWGANEHNEQMPSSFEDKEQKDSSQV